MSMDEHLGMSIEEMGAIFDGGEVILVSDGLTDSALKINVESEEGMILKIVYPEEDYVEGATYIKLHELLGEGSLGDLKYACDYLAEDEADYYDGLCMYLGF